MRRLLNLFILFIFAFVLTACLGDDILQSAYDELSIEANLEEVTENLSLVSSIGDVLIEWKSSNEGVIKPNGEVRQRDGERVVTLIATLKYKDKTLMKEFVVKVPSKKNDTNQPGDNEELVNEYKSWLDSFFTNTNLISDLELPSTNPALGGQIEWKSSNESAMSSLGKVTRSSSDQSVTLTASVVFGANQFEKSYTLTILKKTSDVDYESISKIRSKAINSSVTVVGVVTEVIGNNAYLQDETSGIYLYLGSNANFEDYLEVGNQVSVKGVLEAFNGLIQVAKITDVKVLSHSVNLPKVVEIASFANSVLESKESMRIKFNNFTIKKLPSTLVAGKDNFIELSDGVNSINLFISKHLDQGVIDELNNKLKWFKVNDKISMTGLLVGNYNGYQLVLSRADNIVDRELTIEEKFTAVKDSLASFTSLDGKNLTSKFNLLTSSIYGSKITYTSSHPNVFDVNVFNPTDIDVVVTVKYIIEIDGQTFPEYSIMITVKAKGTTPGPITDLSDYYKSAEGLASSGLKLELNRIISKNYKSIGYSDTSYILDETDVDPNNSKNVLLIYNRASISGVWDGGNSWNKEHVWPQSKLGTASKSDLHNLRPANPRINSDRGNLPFVNGSGSFGKVGSGWFPGEEDKGDVARIVLYMNVRWNLEISKGGIGELSTFLKWHQEDPVDDFERNRNEVIFRNQNNRNPFIDYPEFVNLIWGAQTQILFTEFGIVSFYQAEYHAQDLSLVNLIRINNNKMMLNLI